MARKRYTAEEVATILSTDKHPDDVNLESSFECEVSLAEADLNQPIFPEPDSGATYVSASSIESESGNDEVLSGTMNEELSDTISTDTYYKTRTML